MLFFFSTMRVNSTKPSGKSLMELLIVLVIIALLVTLAFPTMGWMRAKASYAGCIANIRSIHGGFASYLGDHSSVWPQIPDNLERTGLEGDMVAKFWYEALKDYGISTKTWVCPADDHFKAVVESDILYDSTYSVTQFDEQPNRAYQWAAQPWVVENGEFHGKGQGPNVLFPDGHIERGIPLMVGQ